MQKLSNLADLCLDSMSVICNIMLSRFDYDNINIFLSNDHIWNYRNLNSPISKTQLGIVFKVSGFSRLRLLSCDRRLKAEIAKVSRFAFTRVGLF